jgi:photosystem II stability/assembly factor-like uncharacterized protein
VYVMRAAWVCVAALLACGMGQARAEWTSLGPGGGGWLWSLAVAPDEGGTVYVGCDVGGLYRSSDHGATWVRANQGLQNLYVQAIAFDPVDPATVYVGTRGGVHKSTDRGDHWALKRAGFPEIETWGISAAVAAVAVDPRDRRRVFAGIGEPRTGRLEKGRRGGLYVSHDGAETWEFVASPPELTPAQVFSFAFDPAAQGVVVAATSGGVFGSTDGGTTWSRSSDGLPAGLTMEIAADGGTPGVFYATFADEDPKTGGVARSADGGRSWEVVTSGTGRDWRYWRLATAPGRAGLVYAALREGPGILKSTDGGRTWTRVTREENVHSAWFGRGFIATALALDPTDPERLYYGNDMDLYATTDDGGAWRQVATDLVRPATPEAPAAWCGRGLETTCSSTLAVAAGEASMLYLGYWDTGLWTSADGGRSFTWSTQWMGYGKAAAVAVDPELPWRAWVAYGSNYGPHRIFRTDDYGRDWRLVGYEDTGLPPGAVWALQPDPHSPPEQRVVYATVDGHGIFRSEDAGESWRPVGEGLIEPPAFTSLAIDPTDSRRLFVGVRFGRKDGETLRGGVYRSLDAGATWQGVGDIPERPRVVIAPSNPQVVYVGERDYSSVGRGGVYRSADGGETWRLMAERLDDGLGNLPRTYVAALAVDPRDADHVYATSVDESYDLSCGKGVFESRDGGATWHPLNKGLSHWNVHNLLIDPTDADRLYAGTGGNGFFRWGPAPEEKPLPPAPASPLPPDSICTTTDGWSCSAEKTAEIAVHDEGSWWGRGYVLARMDTERHGCILARDFAEPVDISQGRIVSLRLRGVQADGEPLCISRMQMVDRTGRRLLYERDLLVDTCWSLVELPLRDWEGKGFDRTSVARYEFEFWAPYAQARPYELGVGRLAFRP